MDELRRIRDSLETGLASTDTAVKDVVADAARDTLKAVDTLDSDIADGAADLVRIAAGLAQATDSILSKDAEDADTAGRNLLAELTAFVDGPSPAKAASAPKAGRPHEITINRLITRARMCDSTAFCMRTLKIISRVALPHVL